MHTRAYVTNSNCCALLSLLITADWLPHPSSPPSFSRQSQLSANGSASRATRRSRDSARPAVLRLLLIWGWTGEVRERDYKSMSSGAPFLSMKQLYGKPGSCRPPRIARVAATRSVDSAPPPSIYTLFLPPRVRVLLLADAVQYFNSLVEPGFLRQNACMSSRPQETVMASQHFFSPSPCLRRLNCSLSLPLPPFS